MWRFQSFSTQKHTRSDWHIKMWPNTIHTWQILAHLILSSLWKQNPDIMLQFHHDDWLQLDDRLLYFILSLFPLHSSRCANLFQLLHPTLNSGYRELKFHWRKSLQQTGTLTWNCPVFFLSQFFFSRIAFQFFLLAKRTIIFLFDLPKRYQSSMSSVLILTPICWKLSTRPGNRWISKLLHLLYWSCLFRSDSDTEILLSKFSTLWRSSRKTIMIESVTFNFTEFQALNLPCLAPDLV